MENIALLLVYIVAAIGVWVSVYRRRNRAYTEPGSSVLLSYYTDGADVMPLKKGHVGGLRYMTIATMPPVAGQRTRSGPIETALLYRIELPYSARIHMLAIPKQSGATQLNPAVGKSMMEQVSLEGDFDSYFKLFCDKGMQAETRYVLDPKAMAFVVDFCQSHNWEIIRNELYFVQASGTSSPDDPTTMFQDIEAFVNQIRPALEKPLTPAELQALTPYGEERRPSLPCPVCTEDMPYTGEYFRCPAGHGILATGKVLPRVIAPILPHQVKHKTAERSVPLACPSCGSPMAHVAYNASATIIDSCTTCAYRWLDSGEAKPK